MALALVTLTLISAIGLIVTMVFGYMSVENLTILWRHVSFATISTLIILLSHSMTMFYLIGTGKAIKQAVKENGLDKRLAEETIRFKSKVFPLATLAILLIMSGFIIGGGVATHVIPSIAHEIVAWMAAISNMAAFFVELKYLFLNNLLGMEVNKLLEA